MSYESLHEFHRSYCCVGGGTAGWFSAVTLNKYFPYKDIVCIESKDVPRVGVLESTWNIIHIDASCHGYS